MSDIKPIQTFYKGYRFRSRLEVRWAVFFDTLGVPYEYELEGYSLPSGKAYLPDFFLPDLDVFVEVKPVAKIPLADLQRIGKREGTLVSSVTSTRASREVPAFGARLLPPLPNFESSR